MHLDTTDGKIGIVGAGLIGAGWAAFYASNGFAVGLFDAVVSARQAGRERTFTYLGFLREHDLLDAENCDRAVAGIAVTDDLSDAAEHACLVQESVVERYDVKKSVFRQIDQAAKPDTLVASRSSGLLISELQTVMGHPGRSLIAHPFNPPHRIPLVELVPGKQSTLTVMAEAETLSESLGKMPVVLNSEVPGHIANRLQAAVWREAIGPVLQGVASVSDVDKAMAAGPGLRWALFGPHMILHLGGGVGGMSYFIDHVGQTFDKYWTDMAHWTSLPATTTEALVSGVQEEAGDSPLQEIARWRDEKIVHVLKVIHES